MTLAKAIEIGSRQGLVSVGLGVLIGQLIMTLMISSDVGIVKGFLWVTEVDYWPNIIVGIIVMFVCGHFYGQLAGKMILIKRWNFVLTGFIIGFAVLLTTAFLASWIGFIQEGVDNIGTNDDPFVDYIFKPMYWVGLFGLIPALLVGTWFGGRIKKKGKELNSIQHPI